MIRRQWQVILATAFRFQNSKSVSELDEGLRTSHVIDSLYCQSLLCLLKMQEKILPDKRKIKEQAELFAALANPTRLRLLQVLCLQSPPGCRCVNNLSQLLGISQPAVSQHLRVLKSIGLVIGERRGFRMHYLIDPEGLKKCQGILSTTLEFGSCEEDSCKQDCHSKKVAA